MKRYLALIEAVSIRHPLAVALVLVPLVLAATAGIFRVDFEDGLRSMFLADSVEFRDYAALSRNFDASETDVVVLISGPNRLNGEDFSAIRDFILEAQFIDGIDGVFSVFSLRVPGAQGAGPAPLFPADLSDASALERALEQARARSPAGIALVSDDGRESVVIFSLKNEMSDMIGPLGTLERLRDTGARMLEKRGLEAGIAGLLPLREAIIKGLKRDQMKLNLTGAGLGFLLSLLLFRSFWVAVLNTATPVIALIFCLGAFGWLGLSINALTNALPVLILVLATSDSIHLTFEIRHRMAAGETAREAVRHAIRDIAAPCVLTSLTTILAFASLFYSASPIVRDLAMAGAAGVFLAMVTVLFVHPVVFLIGARIPAARRAIPMPPRARVSRGGPVLHWVSTNYRKVSVLGIGLCLIGLWALLPVRPEYRFLENIDAESRIATLIERVEQVSGPINRLNLPLRLKEGVTVDDPRVLDDLDRLHAALGGVEDVRAVVSLASLQDFQTPGDGEAAPPLAETLQQLPERFRARMIGHDGARLQLLLLVPDNGSSAVAALARRIKAVADGVDLKVLTPERPTGFLVMSAALADDMIRQLTVSFLIAALACPALIGAWYRRLDFALAAVVPNILPIALAGAGLTLFGYGIQITSALALTIAFGIALDDSIHVFNRLELQRRKLGQGLSPQAVAQGMIRVSPVLVSTTIILIAGISATAFSEMPMIRQFGALCAITFLLALLSDLILLPALITWFGVRTSRRKGTQP